MSNISMSIASEVFPIDPENPTQAAIDAQNFYDSLPTLYPDPNMLQGGVGERMVPFLFVAGGMWVIVYILLYNGGRH